MAEQDLANVHFSFEEDEQYLADYYTQQKKMESPFTTPDYSYFSQVMEASGGHLTIASPSNEQPRTLSHMRHRLKKSNSGMDFVYYHTPVLLQ